MTSIRKIRRRAGRRDPRAWLRKLVRSLQRSTRRSRPILAPPRDWPWSIEPGHTAVEGAWRDAMRLLWDDWASEITREHGR